MRNSTGSPLFSDFKSDLSRVVRSRPLVKGNEDAGYEGVNVWSSYVLHTPSIVESEARCGRDPPSSPRVFPSMRFINIIVQLTVYKKTFNGRANVL